MRHKFKFIKWLTASLMMASQFPVATVNAEESKITYEDVLGDALNYGIVANEYEQVVHTQTNFAVNKYTASGQVIEVNISGSGNVPMIVNDFSDEVRFGGSTASGDEMTYNIVTSKENESRSNKIHADGNRAKINIAYKEKNDVSNLVNSYINKIKTSSETLANHSPTITLNDEMVNDQNHYTLDLTKYGNETVYVNIPNSANKFLNVMHTTDALNIEKNSETTVVFNVDQENVFLGKYHVTVNGKQINTETSVGESDHNIDVDNEILQKIIWNFHNAKSVELNVTAGLFLSPNSESTVRVSGTSAGWIATGGKAINNGGEWHFAFHSRQFTGDDVVPTPVPTPTPAEPTPEPVKNGTLTITKTIAGDVNKEEAEGALKFKITNNDTAESNEYTLSDFEYDSNTNKYSKCLTLNTGGYTVEESVSDISGYTLAYVGYRLNGADAVEGKSATVSIDADSNNSIDYVDTYKVPTYEVSIGKVDINDSHELPGATLRVAQNGKTIEEWLSTDEDHKISLQAGEYTLSEITAPTGYEVAESMNFTVTSEGKVTVNGEEVSSVIMKDVPTPKPVEKTSVSVRKVFEDDNNRDGIRPLIVHVDLVADGTSIDTVTLDSSNSWAYTWSNLDKMNGDKAINYMVLETPVNGYTASVEETSENNFTITNTHIPETVDIVVDTVWDDLDNKDDLRPEGYDISLMNAKLKVKEANLNTDNQYSYTFEDMPANENGHEIDYSVEMDEDIDEYSSTLTGSPEEGFTFTHLERTPEPEVPETHDVKIRKVDISGKEIEGAALEVSHIENDMPVVDEEWISTSEPHEITLRAGEYTLTEKQSPDGYELAESINFIVNENGAVIVNDVAGDSVIMCDKYSNHDVVISKENVGGKELEGADLSVTNSTGDVVEVWKSTTDKHTLSLQPGNYTLHENTAPAGYKVANDIEFTVGLDGTVTIEDKVVNQITMIDEDEEVIPTTGKLVITKTIKGPVSKEEASESLKFKVTNNDSNEETEYDLSSFTYDETTGKYTKELSVNAGGYTVEEYVTDIEGYKLTSVKHIIEAVETDGTVAYVTVLPDQSITVDYEDTYEDETYTVIVSKQDNETKKELDDAKLMIKTSEGKKVETWETDSSKPHEVKLVAGKYILYETKAPVNYKLAKPIEFEVKKDGSAYVNGNRVDSIVMYDKKATVISDKPEEPKPTETANPKVPSTPTTIPETSKQVTSTNPSTSDNSNVFIYLGVLVASVAAIGVAIFVRKKQK